MQLILNFVVFFVLSAFGVSTYFLNPYRSGSLIVGLLLQAFAIVVLFLSTVSQKHALNRYKNAAKDTVQSNQRWLIGSIAAVCISGALLLIGIPYSFLRFILFLLLWAGAIGAGQYLCYFIWRRDNEELAVQLVKEDEEKRAQELAAQERAKAAAEQMRKDAQERAARAATWQTAPAVQNSAYPAASGESMHESREAMPELEIPDSIPPSMTRPRMTDAPDMFVAMRLHIFDEETISKALEYPTRSVLAAVQYEIAYNSISPDIVFYRLGELPEPSDQEREEARRKLLALAKSHRLYVNPAWTQSLIVRLGNQANLLLQDLVNNCVQQDIFAYELISLELFMAKRLLET